MTALLNSLLWAMIAIASRLLPHPPNVTAMTSYGLLSQWLLPKRYATLVFFSSVVASDLLLARLYHYPAFGLWSVFTYSGYFVIVALARIISVNTFMQRIGLTLCASGSFWLWTNFGVWLTSNMYAHDALGLLDCYTQALPFLRNSVLGDVCWMSVFLTTQGVVSRYARCNGFQATRPALVSPRRS